MSRAERADWIARRFASLSLSVLLSVVWLALLAAGLYMGRMLYDWGTESGQLAQALQCNERVALIEGQMLEQSRTIAELEKKFAPDPMRKP